MKSNSFKKNDILRIGREVLENEAAAVKHVAEKLDSNFAKAVRLICECKGKIILSGLGKSGIVARKIAATLSSTGTFSLFLHPTEALHGDLGMVETEDAIVLISHSGETPEVVSFVAAVRKNFKNKIVLIAGTENSTLAKVADVVLLTRVAEEACKICTTFNLAPTTSTLVTLAIGDALASALQELKGIKLKHFAKIHPGGTLGKKSKKKGNQDERKKVEFS